jgi:hypothetical protein
MSTDSQLDVRPRTTGELLDDAVRLALADAPLLLAASGTFLVPASIALLFLLAFPAADTPWRTFGLPGLAALLLSLTGIGSGACQELFRRRSSDIPASLRGCLGAARRRGLAHCAARTLALAGSLLGLVLLIVPGIAVWTSLATAHTWLVQGNRRFGECLRESARALQRNSAKLTAVAATRFAATLFVAVNLHVLVRVGSWAAGNLAGLDLALVDAQLSLGNSTYFAGLLLLGWWLLAPFAEACNYLLYVDTRVRYEGLDLWHRVQRLFPLTVRTRATPAVIAAASIVAFAAPLHADDRFSEAVAAARKSVAKIAEEVRATEPYPGGARWVPRLRAVAASLQAASDGRPKRFAWLDRVIESFPRRQRPDALETLDGIERRLALLAEASASGAAGDAEAGRRILGPDETRALLPERAGPADEKKPKEEPKRKQPEDMEIEARRPRDGGSAIGVPAAGFGVFAWALLAGLLVACVVVAVMLYLQHRRYSPKTETKRNSGKQDIADSRTQPDCVPPAAFWHQADDLARKGNFLEAVRCLYLAVLAMLHRAHVIRYEKTRTNGEYRQQARRTPEAPAGLHAPFGQMTDLFDRKWYGERACDDGDYGACRTLAEQIRAEVNV